MNLDFSCFSSSSTPTATIQYRGSYKPIDGNDVDCVTVGNEYEVVHDHLGDIRQNSVTNFWTFGRFSMGDVLKYILLQVGPSDVSACTWAITTKAVEDILMLRDKGYIKSFRLWIDPRVKVRNPQPLQMLQLNFPLTIAPVHAKVTCISNDDWHISISGSLNFTSNPQPERGTICTVPHVWQADNEIIDRQFSSDIDVIERHKLALQQQDYTTSTTADFADTSEQMDSVFTTTTTADIGKRKAWKEAVNYTEPRCNLKEKIKYHQRSTWSLISSFERTDDGYELNAIKSDFYNVTRFADSACTIIEKLIGSANRDLYALVIPPKRRHTVKNFAEEVAKVVAEREKLHFYPDAVTAQSKHRVNAIFDLTTTISEPIVIIYDDIITTGSTLRSTGKLFPDKSVLYVVGIYNS